MVAFLRIKETWGFLTRSEPMHAPFLFGLGLWLFSLLCALYFHDHYSRRLKICLLKERKYISTGRRRVGNEARERISGRIRSSGFGQSRVNLW